MLQVNKDTAGLRERWMDLTKRHRRLSVRVHSSSRGSNLEERERVHADEENEGGTPTADGEEDDDQNPDQFRTHAASTGLEQFENGDQIENQYHLQEIRTCRSLSPSDVIAVALTKPSTPPILDPMMIRSSCTCAPEISWMNRKTSVRVSARCIVLVRRVKAEKCTRQQMSANERERNGNIYIV